MFLCWLMLSVFIEQIKNGGEITTIVAFAIFSTLFFVLGIYSTIRFAQNTPVITLKDNKICFGKSNYSFDEIEQISLAGQKPFKYLFDYPLEGGTIEFKNGEKKHFYDDAYKNSGQIKDFIEQVIINKKEYVEHIIEPTQYGEVQEDFVISFKGNPLLSFFSMPALFSIGLLVFMIADGAPFSLAILCLIILFLSGTQLYYFELTDKHLVIKNHIFFWVKDAYRLHEIKELVFEGYPKASNCLRIIVTNFDKKIYGAAQLRSNTWLSFKTELETKGVAVRNESI